MPIKPVTWWDALPNRLEWELETMAAAAPGLTWDGHAGVWEGVVPLWPFERPAPHGLGDFVGSRRLSVAVVPLEAHPAVPPRFLPLDPAPGFHERTQHRWHVNGDGTICMFQQAVEWTGQEPCAALVPKASGWFLEFLLMKAGLIDAMSEAGIADDPTYDALFASPPAVNG